MNYEEDPLEWYSLAFLFQNWTMCPRKKVSPPITGHFKKSIDESKQGENISPDPPSAGTFAIANSKIFKGTSFSSTQ